jgi:hypothetical protein
MVAAVAKNASLNAGAAAAAACAACAKLVMSARMPAAAR